MKLEQSKYSESKFKDRDEVNRGYTGYIGNDCYSSHNDKKRGKPSIQDIVYILKEEFTGKLTPLENLQFKKMRFLDEMCENSSFFLGNRRDYKKHTSQESNDVKYGSKIRSASTPKLMEAMAQILNEKPLDKLTSREEYQFRMAGLAEELAEVKGFVIGQTANKES